MIESNSRIETNQLKKRDILSIQVTGYSEVKYLTQRKKVTSGAIVRCISSWFSSGIINGRN